MAEPFSVADVMRAKNKKVPDLVVEAVNFWLTTKWDGVEAIIEQRALAEELDCDSINAAYGMLDGIEELYATQGWVVKFVQPEGGRNATWFEPYYQFTLKPAPSPFGNSHV